VIPVVVFVSELVEMAQVPLDRGKEFTTKHTRTYPSIDKNYLILLLNGPPLVVFGESNRETLHRTSCGINEHS
jgi:hypothetical protein